MPSAGSRKTICSLLADNLPPREGSSSAVPVEYQLYRLTNYLRPAGPQKMYILVAFSDSQIGFSKQKKQAQLCLKTLQCPRPAKTPSLVVNPMGLCRLLMLNVNLNTLQNKDKQYPAFTKYPSTLLLKLCESQHLSFTICHR